MATTIRLTSGYSYLSGWDRSTCPAHADSPLRKRYVFRVPGSGRAGASIYTFTACKCAICEREDAFDSETDATYHVNYALAADRGKLLSWQSKALNS